MKKPILALVFIVIQVAQLSSQTLDPGYAQKFGNTAIVASGKGKPDPGKLDPALFDYKEGKFYIQAGAGNPLNLMALLPQGMNIDKLIEKLKKDKPQNMKYYKYSIISWRAWCSHNGGRVWYTEKLPWPKSINDIPRFDDPKEVQIDYEKSQHGSITTPTLDINSTGRGLLSLEYATPNSMYYIMFTVAYAYLVPGGQLENKWDMDLKKFVPQKSVGLMGFVYSDPIVVGTIEITEAEKVFKPFTSTSSDITDNTTGYTWETMLITVPYTHEEALKGYDNAFNGTWRLPSPAEFQTLIDISVKNDPDKCCGWLKKEGFEYLQKGKYWTNETNGTEATVVDFEKMEFIKVPVTEKYPCMGIKR